MIHIEIPKPDGIAVKQTRSTIPKVGGFYALFGVDSELLYVGKTANIQQRISQHLLGSDSGTGNVSHNIVCALYWINEDPVEREIYETWMINNWKPPWNCDKVFTYKTDRYNPKWRIPEELEEEEREHKEFMENIARKIRALG